MRRIRVWFSALVAAQALFLLGWAGWLEAELARAPTVLLEVRPVDPAEILRGDYIRLGYVIADVPKARFSGSWGADYGEPVCIEVRPGQEFWEVASAHVGRCAGGRSAPDRLGIQGSFSGYDDDSVTVDYGIDRYYVPEGMGTPRGRLTARVAVTSWHRPLLKQLYLDGRPYP